MLTTKHPLRRLLAGAGSIAAASILYLGAIAHQDAGPLLSVAAECTALLGLGFLIAAGLGYVNNVLVRFVARYPSLSRRLHLTIGVVLLFLCAAYAFFLSLGTLWSGSAPVISRQVGSVPRAGNETYFFASVAFHFIGGLVLLWGTWFVLRKLRREP